MSQFKQHTMRLTTLIILSIAFAAISCSCKKIEGKGPMVSETRALTDFTGIDMALSGNVEVKKGVNFEVVVTAQQNILDVLKTTKTGSVLLLKFKDGTRVKHADDIKVTITLPVLHSVHLSGSGNLEVKDEFEGTDLSASISGSGNIFLGSLIYNNINASISGSGGIRATGGTANSADLRISGSGAIAFDAIQVKEITTKTSGSGSMRVWATDKLNASISGSGSVAYKGDPVVSEKVSGSGRVTKL